MDESKIDAIGDLSKRILPEIKEAQLYRSIAALRSDVAFGRGVMIILGLAAAYLLGYITKEIQQ